LGSVAAFPFRSVSSVNGPSDHLPVREGGEGELGGREGELGGVGRDHPNVDFGKGFVEEVTLN